MEHSVLEHRMEIQDPPGAGFRAIKEQLRVFLIYNDNKLHRTNVTYPRILEIQVNNVSAGKFSSLAAITVYTRTFRWRTEIGGAVHIKGSAPEKFKTEQKRKS